MTGLSRRAVLGAAALVPVAACAEPESAPPPAPTPSEASPPSSAPPSPSSSAAPSRAPQPRIAATVADGLAVPWGIAFLPGGSAIVGERDTARLLHVAAPGRVREIGEVPDVVSAADAGGEGGLLGLALHPSGDAIYAYHTSDHGNRVVRLPFAGTAVGKPSVVLDGIAAATHHNGGGLLFAPDGALFVSTGDAEERDSATDTGSLNGKILRITDRGGVPADNPFGNPVWSFGHRNVEGLAFDEQGRLWASEFGENAYDELNRIVRGGDYGWPDAEGSDGPGGGRDPLTQWATDECSPSGIAVTGGHAFLGALQGQCVWSVDLDTGRSRRWLDGHGRLRLVATAPDGSLWVGTSNKDGRGSPAGGDDRIFRVTV